MKTLIIILGTLSILSFIGGIFGTTPNGDPATHQFFVGIFTGIITVLLVKEYRRKSR